MNFIDTKEFLYENSCAKTLYLEEENVQFYYFTVSLVIRPMFGC